MLMKNVYLYTRLYFREGKKVKKSFSLILLLSVSLFGCVNEESAGQVQSQAKDTTEAANSNVNEEGIVVDLVGKFGSAFKKSLY